MSIGPTKISHVDRMKIAEDIAASLKERFKEHVIAISIYGSLAKGTDGPYSDIEMDCVLEGLDCDHTLEWCGGGWKAEVDFYSVQSMLKRAAEVDAKWPISHGIYVHYLPFYDPTNLYVHRKKAALSQPDHKFRRAIRDLIVGDMFEYQGKIRNAGQRQDFTSLPYYAIGQARWGALMLGLANHHLYSSSAKIFPESLELDGRPDGYEDLCQLVMRGTLANPDQTMAMCDKFWEGVNKWAQERGIRLVDDFQDLLAKDPVLA